MKAGSHELVDAVAVLLTYSKTRACVMLHQGKFVNVDSISSLTGVNSENGSVESSGEMVGLVDEDHRPIDQLFVPKFTR